MPVLSDYLHQKASRNKIPLQGAFELSPVCNFSCRMCYLRQTPEQLRRRGKQLIDWRAWLDLADQCMEAGMLYLLLTGGEPFAYPHFRELYTELHKKGLVLSINSNGSLIDRETVEWLTTAALSRVNITLYGASPETYRAVCGRPDGYERAMEAIRMLKETGIPVVINASMIPENACDMERIMDIGKELGINTRVATYMFPPARREAETEDSRFSPAQSAEMYLRRMKHMQGETKYRRTIAEKLEKIEGEQEGAAGLQTESSTQEEWGSCTEFMHCRAGRSAFWVSWEGKMSACGMMPFPEEADPFAEPFRDCWLRITEKVRTSEVLRACAGCKKKEICSPCAAMLFAETGDVNGKAPYLCEMTDCITACMEKVMKEETTHEQKEII